VAGVQPLHHRAFLRRHQPGGERAGDAEGVKACLSERRSMLAAVAAATNTPQVAWKWCPRMNSAPVAARPTRRPA
jgi:hypothetical protein